MAGTENSSPIPGFSVVYCNMEDWQETAPPAALSDINRNSVEYHMRKQCFRKRKGLMPCS